MIGAPPTTELRDPCSMMMRRQSCRSTELPPVLEALAEGSSTLSA
jgi:hypothetical protein